MSRTYVGHLAAKRLEPGWWPTIERFSVSAGVDPALIASIIAVETLARGWLVRRVEVVLAHVLIALRIRRGMSFSVGLGQVSLRLAVRDGETAQDALHRLTTVAGAIEQCTAVVIKIGDELGLNVNAPVTWSSGEWGVFGYAYSGDGRYGGILRKTFEALARKRAAAAS